MDESCTGVEKYTDVSGIGAKKLLIDETRIRLMRYKVHACGSEGEKFTVDKIQKGYEDTKIQPEVK